MKAFRGQPRIFASDQPAEKRADLEVQNVTLNFGGVMAIHDVSLTVHTGEFVSVIGPNGAGKTSLMNSITGYYKPQRGKILFNDQEIMGHHPHEVTKKGIGRTYQNIELFPGMTVLSNMLLARHLYCNYGFGLASVFSSSVRKEEVRHRRVLEELIDFLEMQPIRKKPVGSLPYGLRKRVELGRALALEPKLLVLDEPFAGMTLEEKEDMVRFLLELNSAWGQTMILVEHDMSIVMSVSQRIMVLNFGEKIAEGTPEQIQNHPEVIKAYLGETTKF
ncbi:MAG: ABC transporter ATP-binding protein [Deltaproteobacteria bacterium RBG_16_49_23]|nr:MAG: ABC transporter ATP-binding protein [Deltaproteobacteria bacterium RBG_16_49_23]